MRRISEIHSFIKAMRSGRTGSQSGQAKNPAGKLAARSARSYIPRIVGVWLSLVEHLVRDEGVVGSNPITPTIFQAIRSRTARRSPHFVFRAGACEL
jgi:hypothetical protein